MSPREVQSVDPDLRELERAVGELLTALRAGPATQPDGVAAIQALLPKLTTLTAVVQQRAPEPATRHVLVQLRPLLRACQELAQDQLDLVVLEQRWLGVGRRASARAAGTVDQLA